MARAQQIVSPLSEPPAVPSRQRYRVYLWWATLIPLLAWAAAFPLVCSRSYEQWGETQWGPVLEFPYEAGTPSADVVIFGDSSAFLGIDPKQLNQELGIHSVVLPSTVGSLPVIGDAPLRSYLARHPRPRVVVLYFSSWNLDFAHMAPGRLFEGEEMMLRHASRGEILHYGVRHPLELLAFPIRLYSTFGSKMVLEFLHGKSLERDTASGLGHTPYNEPFGPLHDLCRIPTSFLKQRGDASVAALQQRYAGAGIEVMVYLAPVPACTNAGEMQRWSFADLQVAPPRLLPATDFAADPYYAHIEPRAVPVATGSFAEALKARLQQVAPDLLSGPRTKADR